MIRKILVVCSNILLMIAIFAAATPSQIGLYEPTKPSCFKKL